MLHRQKKRKNPLGVDRWSWESIAGQDGVVDVYLNTGLLARVYTGDGDLWWVAAGATGDLELSAGNIELGAGVVGSTVEGDMLNTKKVKAASNPGWEFEG
jgi:hypothetical protein